MSALPQSADEREILTREAAEILAEACRGQPDPLASERIPPSLLAAEEIKAYVLKTGLISPFFEGGLKPRLKKASYEGRIGSTAYEYRDGELTRVPLDDQKLKIPANSIVFVESDLDFRLPDYIALRFNLHITHVHRGLLLGTGPLVDPGFWGKLCIPLHNLTSEPYEIPINEGLIWIEFTRTTLSPTSSGSIGVVPANTGFWDIAEFIIKASRSYGLVRGVPIQSSIPLVVSEANDRSKKAETGADLAVGQANSASEAVKSLNRRFYAIGLGSAVAAAVAVGALLLAYFATSDARDTLVQGYVDAARNEMRSTKTELRRVLKRIDKLEDENQKLADALERLSTEGR